MEQYVDLRTWRVDRGRLVTADTSHVSPDTVLNAYALHACRIVVSDDAQASVYSS